MRTALSAFFLMSLGSLSACSENQIVLDETGGVDGTDDTGGAEEEEEPDYSMYDGAVLTILSPEAGDFLPLGEEARFEAQLTAADGSDLEFEELGWTSTVDEDWVPLGLDFEDDGLSVGLHTITATAALPNGDRLVSAIGGVLVQHEDAGLYVGNLYVDTTVEYDGSDITTTCIGATVLVVDQEGETATGESSCTLALLGYSIDAAHVFEFDNDDGELSGETSIDFVLGSYGFDITGSVGGGALAAEWSDDVYGQAQIDGSLALDRVSRDTTY